MILCLMTKSFTEQIAKDLSYMSSKDHPSLFQSFGKHALNQKDIQNALDAAKWEDGEIFYETFQEKDFKSSKDESALKVKLENHAKFRNAVRQNNLDMTAEKMQHFLNNPLIDMNALKKKNVELNNILTNIPKPYVFEKTVNKINFDAFRSQIQKADLGAAEKLLDAWDPIKAAFDKGYKKEYETLKDRIDILRWQKRFFKDDRVAYTYFQGTKVKKICFLLQGLGDTAKNFANYAPKVDNVLYIVPQPFEKWTIFYPYTFNYSWFPLGKWGFLSTLFPDKEMILEGSKRACDELSMWIKSVMYEYKFTYDNVFIIGFSLGAILASRLMEQDINLKRAIIVSGGSPDETFEPFEGEDVESEKYLVINWKDDPLITDELVQNYLKRLKKMYPNVDTKQVSQCLSHPDVIACDETQAVMRDWIKKHVFNS